MHQDLHILTRISRPEFIANVATSVLNLSSIYAPSNVYWHLLVDAQKVNIDQITVPDLPCNTVITPASKRDGDSYLHEEMSLYCRNNIQKGWIIFIDDDNIIHENFTRCILPLLNNVTEDVILVHQDVDFKSNTGIKIREAIPENMRVGKVDIAQAIFSASVFRNNMISRSYTGDSELLEQLYRADPSSFRFANVVAAYYNYSKAGTPSFLPTVLYIGEKCEVIKTSALYDFSEKYMNIIYRQNDEDLSHLQQVHKIDLYVTETAVLPFLKKLPYEPVAIRKQWIEIEADEENKGNVIYFTLLQTIISRFNKSDLISIFTSTYNTGPAILKTYHTLKNQTNSNWEWVVMDDSTDGNRTYDLLNGIAKRDNRVKVYKLYQDSGRNTGEAKYRAAMLTTGAILVELGHQDWLLPDACEIIAKAAVAHPSEGFFYSDCIEIDKMFKSRKYGENWAFGYGRYRTEVHDVFGRREFTATVAPNINPKTIRHVVSMPNHLRAWRREVYFQSGGHNRDMSTADTYDLMIRTFLNTKFLHIEKTLYIQIHSETEEQNKNRSEITRRSDVLRYLYRDAIASRFNELGIQDWCATEQEFQDAPIRLGQEEGVANLTFTIA